MRQFTSVNDVTDIQALVALARSCKADPLGNRQLGSGKRIGLIFLNPSLRTRLSTQIAAENLGMTPVIFNAGNEGWAWEFEEEAIMSGSTVEHVKDAAPILGRYFDLLALRAFPTLQNKEDDYGEVCLKQFIKYAGVPVVSLESATLHPLQSLTDVLTISETFAEKRRPKVVLTWAPHIKPLPQCVANSFAQWINAWGQADFVITHPDDYELDAAFTEGARIVRNQDEALQDADYVYVKNWSTYTDYGRIYCNDPEWMLTRTKLERTRNARVMHCLPVRRNVELSDEVLDSTNSIVTLQASNRVWAAQAVLTQLLRSNG
ncbi:MAG: hypothetical protein RJA57_1949 [Bacteroidota bacterium]|jgi:N-succinyl-L-ornithine transcarbamylase